MTTEPAGSTNAAPDAIRRVLQQSPFDDPQSDINRRVRAALLALEQRHAAVRDRFAARSAGRRVAADAEQTVALAAAVDMLGQTRTALNRAQSIGDPQLLSTAEAQHRLAELHAAQVRRNAATTSAITFADAADDRLRVWYDELFLVIVRTLHDSHAADRAILLLSGGLTVAGFASGGPAIAAAVAAAALLVSDWRKRTIKRAIDDEDVARREQSIILLNVARDIADEWLTVL